jgi:hypothetical protein
VTHDRDKRPTLVNTVMNLSEYIKGGEFLDCLSDCWPLKKDSFIDLVETHLSSSLKLEST